MDGEERDDRIIREKEFRRSIDIDLGDIEISEERTEESREELASAVDEALGEVFDPFKKPDGTEAGAIQEDGTVPIAPERDIVTEIAVEGERARTLATIGHSGSRYAGLGWICARRDVGSETENETPRSHLGYHLNEGTVWPCN